MIKAHCFCKQHSTKVYVKYVEVASKLNLLLILWEQFNWTEQIHILRKEKTKALGLLRAALCDGSHTAGRQPAKLLTSTAMPLRHIATSYSSTARAHTYIEWYTPVPSHWSQQIAAQKVKHFCKLFSRSALQPASPLRVYWPDPIILEETLQHHMPNRWENTHGLVGQISTLTARCRQQVSKDHK